MKLFEITVEHAYDNPGFCRRYYKILKINDHPPESHIFICVQEDAPESPKWWTTSGEEHEPDSLVGMGYRIVDTEGTVLRPPLLFPVGKRVLTPHGRGEIVHFESHLGLEITQVNEQPSHDEYRVVVKLDPGHTRPFNLSVAYYFPRELVHIFGETSA